MPEQNTNNLIPTSASVFEIVVNQYKDLNSSIKYFSNKGIKNSDIAKIKASIRRSKKAVGLLIDGYAEISEYINKESSVTKNVVYSIVSDPVLFIKSIKEGKSFIDEKQKNELFVLDSYIAIFTLLKTISDFGNSIKLKNIKKLPKVTRVAMSAVVSSLKIVARRAKFIKPIAKATEVTIMGLTNVFGSLLTMQGMLVNFGNQALGIRKMMKIRWGIKQLFLSFVFVLAEMYQLGKFIKTGEYDDESVTNLRILKTTKKRKIEFEKTDLLKTLAIGAGVMVGVTLVLTLMSVMLSQMKTIGTLKTKIVLKATLRNMNTLLFGWDMDADPEGDTSKGNKDFHNNGVLDMMHKIGSDKSVLLESLNFAVVCASLTVGIIAVGIIVKQLRKIWFNSILLKPSLRTLNTLFFGFGTKSDKKYAPGILQTFSNAATKKNREAVNSFMWMSFKLGAAMFVLQNTLIPALVYLGIFTWPIRWGLRSFDTIFNGKGTDINDKNWVPGLIPLMKTIAGTKENRKAAGSFMWMSFKLGAAMFVLQNTLIPALSLMAIAGIPMIIGTRFLSIVLLGGEDPFGNEIPGLIDIISDEKLQEKGILKNGLRLIAISGIFFVVGMIISATALFAPILPIAALCILVINFTVKRILKVFALLVRHQKSIDIGVASLPKIMIPYTTVMGLLKVAKDISFKDIGIAFAIALVAPFITKGMIKVVKMASAMGATEMGITKLAVAAPAYTAFLGLLNKAGETYNQTNFENAHKLVKSSQPIIWTMVRVFKRMGRRIGYKSAIMGSVALNLMATSLISFTTSVSVMSNLLSGLNLDGIKTFLKMVGMMSLLMIIIGLASPLILVGVTTLLALSSALIVFAAAILVLNIALLAFCGVLVVFALAFSLLEKILPGNDTINAVVEGTIAIVIAVSRISTAIYTNISLVQVIFGAIVLAFIDVMLIELMVSGVLFKVVANIVQDITEEQSESILKFIDNLSAVVHGIYEKVNGKELIVAVFTCLGYLVLMVFLMVTAIFTVILYGILSIIDFAQFEKQLGVNSDTGFIPSLGAIVSGIDDGVDGIKLLKVLLKIGGLMIVIGMLNAVALAIKTLSSLEITEFDENGRATGNKVKMKKEDFKTAAENAENMIRAIVGIFYTENGDSTDLVMLLSNIDKDMTKQMKNIYSVVNTIGKIAKIISKMSKFVVPDPAKGFDDKGNALGWIPMGTKDIDNFKTNVTTLISALFEIFDKSSASGKQLESMMDSVKKSMIVKMEVIRSVIGCISNISDIIVKMANSLVPDTGPDKDWYDSETGKVKLWRQLDLQKDISSAQLKIASLMSSFGEIVNGIKDSDIKSIKMRTLKKVGVVMSLITPINSLIDTIIKLGTAQFPIMKLKNDGSGEVELDEEGNPKMTYIGFDQINIDGAMTNIEDIFIRYISGIGGIFKTGYYKKRIKALNKAIKNGIAIEGITDLIDNIIKLATGQFPIMDLNDDGTPNLDEEGNPKMKYVTLTNAMITNAADNIATIVKSYIDSLSSVIGNDVKSFKEKIETINDVFTGSSSIFTIINPMIDNIEKINKVGETGISAFNTNLAGMIYAYNNGVYSITANVDEYKTYLEISSIFKDFVKTSSNLYSEMKDSVLPTNVERTVSATNSFLKQVNSMNDSKLGKMADISKNMATFATKINGNFDSLAKAMNQNIITALDKVDKALKELKDTLDELPEKVGTSVASGIPDSIQMTGIKTEPEPKAKAVKTNEQTKEKDVTGKTQTNSKDKEVKNLNDLIRELGACIDDGKIKIKS